MEDLETISLSEKKSVDSDTVKSIFKLSDVVSIAALLITLTTALLYYLGFTYYSGYLSYWGLPEELFSLSHEKSVMSGVVAYALVCARELLHFLVLLVLIGEVLAIFALLCFFRVIKDFLVRQIRKLFRLSPFVTRHLALSDANERILDRIMFAILIVASPLLLALAIAQTSHWASKQGSEIAETEQKGILSGQSNKKPFISRTVLYVKNNAKGFDQYSGHLIKTSATHCALYSKASGITILPMATVSRMVIRENRDAARK